MSNTGLRTSLAAELGSSADFLRALARPDAPTLLAGTVVAEQFEIEALLGRGGMGAVYRARDRSLGRRVALKLGLHHTDVSRLQHEASTLARLAHPNVVTIYEIGTHEDVLFVVMELCSQSMRDWLATPRPWRAIVERFVAAGRGLAAAHAAGIVHGDVKPDNILLGEDDRARIADFGLARESLDENHQRGAGTPRYMAPELVAGAPASAASDQFAFAVALHEALSGADARGRIAPLAGIPRRITSALARALQVDPAARWPDVSTLLGQLQFARRQRWIAPAVMVGTAVIALAAWQLSKEATEARLSVQPSRCEGLPVDLAADWNTDARTRVSTAHPRGSGAATLLVTALDDFVAEWSLARRRLCKELPTLASWSPALGEMGRSCLLSRRTDLRALIALRDLDPSTIIGHLAALLFPASCADPVRLEPETLEPAVAKVRAEADAIGILRDEGETTAALARGRALVAGLAPDAPPLATAVANALLGELLLPHAGITESAPPTRAAFFAYRVAGSPQAFEPALRLVEAYTQAGELALADEWLAHARAEAARVEVAAANRAALDLLGARLLSLRGDNAAALVEARRVLTMLEASTDPRRALNLIAVKSAIAVFLAELGKLDESVAIAREALTERELLYGLDNPILITDLFNVGLGELERDKPREGLVALTRARTIAEAHLPKDAVLRAYALWNEGLALARSDRPSARIAFDRALAILVAIQPADSPDIVQLRADRVRWAK